MIKIVSGVSDKYFKLNISSYLKQGRDLIQISGNSEAIHSTHPVFPDRVPALMQFEISEPYYQFIKSDKSLMQIINRIEDAKIEDGGSGAFYIFLKKIK